MLQFLLFGDQFNSNKHNANHDDKEESKENPIGGAASFEPDLALSTSEETLEEKEGQGNEVESLLRPLTVASLLINYFVQLLYFKILLGISGWQNWKSVFV